MKIWMIFIYYERIYIIFHNLDRKSKNKKWKWKTWLFIINKKNINNVIRLKSLKKPSSTLLNMINKEMKNSKFIRFINL